MSGHEDLSKALQELLGEMMRDALDSPNHQQILAHREGIREFLEFFQTLAVDPEQPTTQGQLAEGLSKLALMMLLTIRSVQPGS